MAKNLFVNTTGLPIEKEMPSLIGMDLSGVGKEPLKLDIGKTISDFATKAQALKEQANATKLYNQLLDEEQAWKIENLSDPNAFANKERITAITNSYNDLIERKKAIMMGARNGVSAKQYSTLEAQFKQQTYNSLFDLQTKMNSAFVQESVESLGIEKNALTIKCANTGNRDEIMQYQEMLGQCFEAEASLGIDNREQAIKTFMTIEENYMQRKIVDEIINNNTSAEYAKTDANGTPMLDTSGNYIIDTNKVLSAVTNQRNFLLSKESISGDAKRISKIYNISEDDAYNYIYNARDQFFKVKQNNINANLVQKAELEKLQMVELEAEINKKRTKAINDYQNDVNNGQPMTKTSESFGLSLTDDSYYDDYYFNKYTNGEFNNIIEMDKSKLWIPVTDNNTINSIAKKFSGAKDKTEVLGAVQDLKNIQTQKGVFNKFQLLQLQKNGGIPYGTLAATLGYVNEITPEEAIDIFIANQSTGLDTTKIPRNYNLAKYSFPFKFEDTDNLTKVLKNIDRYPNKFFTPEKLDLYNSKVDVDDKFNFIMEEYRKNETTKSTINNLAKKINIMNTVNNTPMYQVDKTENSQFLKYGLDVIDNQTKKENARKLYKSGQGNKLFDVDLDGNIVSAFGYPNDATSLSTTDLDAYNEQLRDLLYSGKINFRQINNYGNGVIFRSQHNVDYFRNVILDMINKNKLNDIDTITSIPVILSDSDPKIQEYLEQIYNEME